MKLTKSVLSSVCVSSLVTSFRSLFRVSVDIFVKVNRKHPGVCVTASAAIYLCCVRCISDSFPDSKYSPYM
jgi:hypothetical protein